MSRYRVILTAAVVISTAAAFMPASGAANSGSARSTGRPVLHAISPTAVPASGARIAIGGTRLKQVHSVSFGAMTVHQVHNLSSTRLTVRAPAHALGLVAVTLHSASGDSGTAQLSYVRAPAPLHWQAGPGIDPHRGELTGMSCVTENFCVAVEHDPNTPTRLLRFGTHIAPKITKVPESAGVRTVGCGTNHFCVAGPATGAYIWNGSRWRGPIHLGGKHLRYGPVCARGTSTCLYHSSTGTLIHKHSGWTHVSLPAGLHVGDRGFGDISCASATFCEAQGTGPGNFVQFARYNGSTWHVDTSAPPLGYERLTCAPPAYCLATGEGDGTAELNGTTWTTLNDDGDGISFLPNNLACGAPGHCVAVGEHFGVAAVFSGGQWTQSGIPDEWAATSGTTARTSTASCPSAGLCRVADLQGRTFDLVSDAWSAGRQLVPASGYLQDISCADRHWCMAIDDSGNALRWQHGHWSAPQPMDPNHGLVAISCAADRTCTAVTSQLLPYPRVQQRGQAIRYIHGHWQHPRLIDKIQPPKDVSCPAAGYCVVVTQVGQLFTFQHNSWSKSDHLFTPDHNRAIDCASTTHCVVIGRGGAWIFNGNTWRHVPGPRLESTIDCVDTSFCVAGTGNVSELHAGVLGRLAVHPSFQACASRTFCVAEPYSGPDRPGGKFEETFNGSAVRRTAYHPANSLACAPGPVCIELTNFSARVGRH